MIFKRNYTANSQSLVSAFYALTFGLLGLVPTRRVSSEKKRH